MKTNIQWPVVGAAVVALFVLAAPAPAQTEVRITPFVGATLFVSDPPALVALERQTGEDLTLRDSKNRDAVTFGTFVGLHLNRLWEVEGLFSYTPSELDARTGLGGNPVDAGLYMYGVHLNFHFLRDYPVTPYLSIGAGGETWDYAVADAEAHAHLMLYGGGGIDLPISDDLAIRLDVRDCLSRDEVAAGFEQKSMHHVLFAAGLSYTLPDR